MNHPLRSTLAATCAATLFLQAAAAAAAPSESTPLDLSQEVNRTQTQATGGSGYLRTLVALILVVALIYAVYWVLQKVRASREESASGAGLSALASLPLGPGRSLHLVRAGRDVLVVGVGEHGVTPIRAYDERAAREAGLLDLEEPEWPTTSDGSDSGGLFDALRRRTVRR